MDDADFDRALVTAAFALAGTDGWRSVSVARRSPPCRPCPLDQARARFPTRDAILMRFGRLADQFALHGAATEGPVRDRLFDIVMRRFDALQLHRAGIRAVLRDLPAHPGLALGLGLATQASMAWMLEAAGIAATGLRGLLRTQGPHRHLALHPARLGPGRQRRSVRHHGGAGVVPCRARSSSATCLSLRPCRLSRSRFPRIRRMSRRHRQRGL